MNAVTDRGFGFLSMRTGLGISDYRYDIFCHVRDFARNGQPADTEYFGRLKAREAIIEFDLVEGAEGKAKAINVREFVWE
jgi:cold shock CspA family protein